MGTPYLYPLQHFMRRPVLTVENPRSIYRIVRLAGRLLGAGCWKAAFGWNGSRHPAESSLKYSSRTECMWLVRCRCSIKSIVSSYLDHFLLYYVAGYLKGLHSTSVSMHSKSAFCCLHNFFCITKWHFIFPNKKSLKRLMIFPLMQKLSMPLLFLSVTTTLRELSSKRDDDPDSNTNTEHAETPPEANESASTSSTRLVKT